jgi:hypothetical protein
MLVAKKSPTWCGPEHCYAVHKGSHIEQALLLQLRISVLYHSQATTASRSGPSDLDNEGYVHGCMKVVIMYILFIAE